MELDYLNCNLNGLPIKSDSTATLFDNDVKDLQNPDEILGNLTIVDEGIPESTHIPEETVQIFTIIDEGILETVNPEDIANLPIFISDDLQGTALYYPQAPVMTSTLDIENTRNHIHSVRDCKEILETSIINDEKIQKSPMDLDDKKITVINDVIIKRCPEKMYTDAIMEQSLKNVPLTHAEIIKNATIIDDGIKLCPLCKNEVRLFYLNFNEKILMCENVDCDYPFGHEDIIIVTNNEDESASSTDMRSSGTRTFIPSATASVISSAAWAEVDKINTLNDIEAKNDPRPEAREYFKHKSYRKGKNTKVEENSKIMKKVKAISKIIHEDMHTPSDPCIKNQKWIRNLLKMQQSSGISLLKPEEMSMFTKQKKPDFGIGELKIDINTDCEKEAPIRIEISNLNSDETVQEKTLVC